MSDLLISTSGGHYRVVVERGSLGTVVNEADVVLLDARLGHRVAEAARARSIEVEGAESTKTLASCEEILLRMRDLGVKRGDTLVALGGGAIQDAATFVASFYMRGIPWVYAPSTAMAMLDSCIGGKSSINIGGVKNLGGNIYPPTSVVVDTELAASLSTEARICGLAEAVKICFAAGPSALQTFLDLGAAADDFGQSPNTDALILHVLATKKWFIEIDEFDKAERQLLNFGHTYGHALESATAFAVPHGVAVALGCLGAVRHERSARNEDASALAAYVCDLLNPIIPTLRGQLVSVDWEAFDRAVLSDKKGTRSSIRLVLPSNEDGVSIVEVPRDEESIREIRRSMQQAIAEVVG